MKRLGKVQQKILIKLSHGWTLRYYSKDKLIILRPPIVQYDWYRHEMGDEFFTERNLTAHLIRPFLTLRDRGFLTSWALTEKWDKKVHLRVQSFRAANALGVLPTHYRGHYNKHRRFLEEIESALNTVYILTPKAWKWLIEHENIL